MSPCRSRCESLNLQLMQPGTASTDAECGNSSLNNTAVVIIVLLVVLGLSVAGSVVALFLWKRYGSGTMCVWWKKMLSWMIRPSSSHDVVDSEVFHLFCFCYRKNNKCILFQKGKFVTVFFTVYLLTLCIFSLLDDNTWLMKVI